jgi:serine/threonine protein kinase
LNEFGKLTHLGSGNFSEIFKATSKKDGKTYAIKQVEKAKVQRIRK